MPPRARSAGRRKAWPRSTTIATTATHPRRPPPRRRWRRRRTDYGGLSGLGLLLDLLDRLLALQAAQVVDEQHAVQVVHLVLDADGEQAFGVLFHLFAGVVEVADLHAGRP